MSRADSVINIATPHVPPYIIAEEGKETRGILVDLIRDSYRRCDVQVNFHKTNWKRAIRQSEHGEVDAIMPLAKATGRENIYGFHHTPLTVFRMAVFHNAAQPVPYRGDLRALTGKTVGTMRNIIVSPAFNQLVASGAIERLELDSYLALMNNLARGRLQAVIGEQRMGKWAALSIDNTNDVRQVGPTFAELPVYLGFSKAQGQSGNVSRFETCLQEELATGSLTRLFAAYGELSR